MATWKSNYFNQNLKYKHIIFFRLWNLDEAEMSNEWKLLAKTEQAYEQVLWILTYYEQLWTYAKLSPSFLIYQFFQDPTIILRSDWLSRNNGSQHISQIQVNN